MAKRIDVDCEQAQWNIFDSLELLLFAGALRRGYTTMLPHLRCLWQAASRVPEQKVSAASFKRLLSTGSFAKESAASGTETMRGAGGFSLSVTEECVRRLRELATRSPKHLPFALRVTVNSGGCAGFQYEFKLEHSGPAAEDVVFEKDGVRVYVDAISAPLLSGATIDYEDELIRSAFKVEGNPNAEANCSCGTSFAPRF